MNVESARRIELEALYDTQGMIDSVVAGAKTLITPQGSVDRAMVGEYAWWLLDVWNVARDKNRDVFCLGGTRKRFGNTFVYGKINGTSAESELVLSQRVDVEEGRQHRSLVAFKSDWMMGQRTLNEVHIGWVLKDLTTNKSVEMNGLTLDYLKSEARLNSEFKR